MRAVSNISSQAEIDRSRIENGEFSIVFGSPEAWLMNDRCIKIDMLNTTPTRCKKIFSSKTSERIAPLDHSYFKFVLFDDIDLLISADYLSN